MPALRQHKHNLLLIHHSLLAVLLLMRCNHVSNSTFDVWTGGIQRCLCCMTSCAASYRSLVLSPILLMCRVHNVGPDSPYLPDIQALAASQRLLVDILGCWTLLALFPSGASLSHNLNTQMCVNDDGLALIVGGGNVVWICICCCSVSASGPSENQHDHGIAMMDSCICSAYLP